MSKDLLKEAIADAKAVRETAIANARLALEEAFTPKLQSMLSTKIQEEEEELEDTDTAPEGDEAAVAADSADTGAADEETEETSEEPAEESYEEGEEVTEEEEEEVTEEEEEVTEMDSELEEIIAELEDEEVEESEEEEVTESEEEEVTESEEEEVTESEEETTEENVDLDEIISALTEEEEEEVTEQEESDLEEAYKTIRFLKDKINEVNLLNAKLLFSNKLFKSNDLNEGQKMKVIETFDRANSVREVKLVYSTLAESFKGYAPKRTKKITEGFASKSTKATAPKKGAIVESNDFANRMRKLAGLI